ncbi:MAG TPA: sensor histidine kinase KdpD [Holophagaceae bacterium]|nr:sensor histidine kinase KdpD [Holophagaceae bacterium]
MTPERPDPDALLRKVQEEEALAARAKLKVFFGAAPGVGKTYAMLSEAKERLDIGIDVVVGVVETHGRSETTAKAEGFERIPPKELPYHGTFYPEFDLEAALKRKPQLILMDELAHSNMKGSRHEKRWQDVMELLDAGIDVYTTVNVQHMESLRDVVAQITGIIVRENVPDTVLERADEVELVDLPPEDLLQRLREGKVYVPDQARHAIDRFFRKGNLLALRELALRQTAQSVDAQMRRYMAIEGIRKTWAAGDRLLVCVGPSALSTRLVRATRRLAATLGAPWTALYVETPRHLRYGEADQARIEANLRLAEQLGGSTEVIEGGVSIGPDILDYARTHNVTKIVVGKPTLPRWQEFFRGSLVDELVRESGDIDIFVITGDHGQEAARPPLRPKPHSPLSHYAFAALAVAAASGASALLFRRTELADIVVVYVLAIVLVAARSGRGPSLVASALSVAAYDFLFIPPYLTFSVSDFRHVGTFSILMITGWTIGTLTERIRQQARLARVREHRTAGLLRLSKDLAQGGGSTDLVESILRNVASQFSTEAVVLLPGPQGKLQALRKDLPLLLTENELGVAQWVFEHQEAAGRGTATLPGSKATYLPMRATSGVMGVLGVLPEGEAQWTEPDQRRLLEAFADQSALALERLSLAEQNAEANRRMDQEAMRSTLLSSVSHDLRTPLGAITGASSTLLDAEAPVPEETRRELLESIQTEAERMHRLVSNLLDITRLESGTLSVRKEWTLLEEVVGSALNRMEAVLKDHPVSVDLPPDLPPVPLDSLLMEQVLVNLLDNAVKHSPPGTPIEIKGWSVGRTATLVVADQGPGLETGDEERIFEKMVRGSRSTPSVGAGLGLAICRAIVLAHGGRITAMNRNQGGAQFLVNLPLPDEQPPMPQEESSE